MSHEVVQLTNRERELLTKHYVFYRSLADGTRFPTTAAQHHFVAVCHGRETAETEHELAWQRLRRLISLTRIPEPEVVERQFRIEVVGRGSESAPEPEPLADLGDMTEYGEGLPAPGWFTDEGWRRMRAGYRYDSR